MATTIPLTDIDLQINNQTGTSYTLTAGDNNKVIVLTNASAITVTCPNSLDVGWNCVLIQGGTGQVTVSGATGSSVNNRSGHSKLAGRHASGSLIVTANSNGTSAAYNFGGDTSA